MPDLCVISEAGHKALHFCRVIIELNYLKALHTLYLRLKDQPITWVITGSLGMAFQGMDVEVHDIDVQTDRVGAYEIERCLSGHVVSKVCFTSSERIRSHFGVFKIDGIRIEVMGDIQKRLSDGCWEEPVDVQRYRRYVALEKMIVPVLSLDHEYEAYLKLGRYEKAEMIRAAITGRLTEEKRCGTETPK